VQPCSREGEKKKEGLLNQIFHEWKKKKRKGKRGGIISSIVFPNTTTRKKRRKGKSPLSINPGLSPPHLSAERKGGKKGEAPQKRASYSIITPYTSLRCWHGRDCTGKKKKKGGEHQGRRTLSFPSLPRPGRGKKRGKGEGEEEPGTDVSPLVSLSPGREERGREKVAVTKRKGEIYHSSRGREKRKRGRRKVQGFKSFSNRRPAVRRKKWTEKGRGRNSYLAFFHPGGKKRGGKHMGSFLPSFLSLVGPGEKGRREGGFNTSFLVWREGGGRKSRLGSFFPSADQQGSVFPSLPERGERNGATSDLFFSFFLSSSRVRSEWKKKEKKGRPPKAYLLLRIVPLATSGCTCIKSEEKGERISSFIFPLTPFSKGGGEEREGGRGEGGGRELYPLA